MSAAFPLIKYGAVTVFDEGAYRKNVLTPFSRDVYRSDVLVKLNNRVQSADVGVILADLADLDLLELLDVPEDINRQVLTNHLKDITGVLRKNHSIKVAQNLLFLLDELPNRINNPIDLTDPEIWLQLQREQARAATRKIAKLANSIAKHSPTNTVSDTELTYRLLAKNIPFDAVSELVALVLDKGVEVTKDFELPELTISAGLQKAIDDAFRAGTARSLAGLFSLNHSRIPSYSVIDSFRLVDATTGIGRSDVQAAYNAAMRAANSDFTEAIKKVTNPGNLGGSDWDVSALQQLALQLAVNLAQERRSRGDDADEMIAELKATGLVDIDARRIVAKILTADTGIITTGVIGAANIREVNDTRAELARIVDATQSIKTTNRGSAERPDILRTDEPLPKPVPKRTAPEPHAEPTGSNVRPQFRSSRPAATTSLPRPNESRVGDSQVRQRINDPQRPGETKAANIYPRFCTRCGARKTGTLFCTNCGYSSAPRQTQKKSVLVIEWKKRITHPEENMVNLAVKSNGVEIGTLRYGDSKEFNLTGASDVEIVPKDFGVGSRRRAYSEKELEKFKSINLEVNAGESVTASIGRKTSWGQDYGQIILQEITREILLRS